MKRLKQYFNQNIFKIIIPIVIGGLLFGCQNLEKYKHLDNINDLQDGKKVVLITSEEGCDTCNKFNEEMLPKITKDNNSNFVIIDIKKTNNTNLEISNFRKQYEIYSLPTILILDNGKLVKKYHPLELRGSQDIISEINKYID